MFKINLSVCKKVGKLIDANIRDLTASLLGVGARIEEKERHNESLIIIECEYSKKEKVVSIIKSILVDIYCKIYKREYFTQRLVNLDCIGNSEKEMLISALVVFDREQDEEFVLESISIRKEFSIDAFFLFRLNVLEDKWSNLVKITRENAFLLCDENSLDMYIRFLLSTAESKTESVRIYGKKNKYIIKPNFFPAITCDREDEQCLITTLIDLAPMKISLDGNVKNGRISKRLKGMFDVMCAKNTLIFGENLF